MDTSFCKAERLDSKLIIDKLFAGGNRSFSVFPLRAVYMHVERHPAAKGEVEAPRVSILISVPKKRFHHAVDRNRVKRLVRECYRKNKEHLWRVLENKDYNIAIAFICVTDTLPDYKQVEKSVKKILARIQDEQMA